MGHLDIAPDTDRRTAGLDSRPPADDRREPRDRGFIALVAVGVAAVGTAVVVIMTSGGDEPATAAYDPVRTPAGTAPATSDPVLDAPASPTAPVGTTAGTPAPASTSAAGAPGTAGSGASSLPAGWEARTFQDVTFAVPPGATGADVVDPGNADAPALFSWTGPSLGGGFDSHVSMWIYSAGGAPTLGPEYQAVTVPGADKAHMWTGPTGGGQASITVDVHIVAGSRYINLNAAVAPGAAGEQMVRDLVAAVVVG